MNAQWKVPALTAVLSTASLALVFAAALQAIPGPLLPQAPAWVVNGIPHLNAVVSATAIASIVAGWRAIRRGDVDQHRRAMLATTGLFAAFLAAYLYRVALVGPKQFPGPAVVEQYLYLPLLAVHVLLAVVCVPLVIYVLLLAVTHPPSELPRTRHPQVGRVAAALWIASFALGVTVYALLYVVY